MDSFVIAEEIVNKWKKDKDGGLVVKLDFEKAYNSVGHDFLEASMEKMGFRERWKGWIRECFSTPRMSVLVNGSLTTQFGIERGLRQGDPISPFLFNIVVEGLKINFSKSCVVRVCQKVDLDLSWATALRCNSGKLPILYLGLPLGSRPSSKEMWRTSKGNGGLGNRRVADKNKTMLAKWVWRFGVEENSLWRKVDMGTVQPWAGNCSTKDTNY
ncbi:hypothetical protein Ddye_013989 [Dipteronia dyeriana]|uniref:Reverse transcriptase domain-containing protein n=1 Tax=Dipteronia dyeriana TaxID=168575 RepID=A0AAE0CKQ8_9ROSI|nr:hypothetical protein Ddye_013989 [Dipteronia dyeriana]